MVSNEKSLLGQHPEKIALVALSVFWNIMDAWGVEGEDQKSLLGIKTDLSTDELKEIHISSLSGEMLERI